MHKAEVERYIRDDKLDPLIDRLFSGLPSAFASDADYKKVQDQLATAFSSDSDNIVLVGSGRFGFSLAPHKFGKPFDSRSDLDLLMVDEVLFDKAWLELVRYDFKSLSFNVDIVNALKEHRYNHVFWGFLEPYRLKNALSFYSRVWFPAFAGLGLLRGTAGRTVKARLYRTWEHARAYHRYSLRAVLAALPAEAQ